MSKSYLGLYQYLKAPFGSKPPVFSGFNRRREEPSGAAALHWRDVSSSLSYFTSQSTLFHMEKLYIRSLGASGSR